MSETKNVVIQQNNGTDYNKIYPEVYDKNVNLSTENASVWGNTLEDALPKITAMQDNQWEVGDLRYTTKNDLSEKWLKCDGSVYNSSDYPRLEKYLNFNNIYMVPKNTLSIPAYAGLHDNTITASAMAYYNQIYYVVYTNYYQCVVGYGNDLNNLTFKTLSTSAYNRSNFTILNNNRVIGIVGEEQNYITGYFSSDLENWKTVDIAHGSNYELQWVKVLNNNWFFCIVDGKRTATMTNDRIFYSTDLIPNTISYLAGKATRSQLEYNTFLDYVDGKYVNLYHDERPANSTLYYATFSDLSLSDYSEIKLNWGISGNKKFLGNGGLFKTSGGYWLVYREGDPNGSSSSSISNLMLYLVFSKTNEVSNFQNPSVISSTHTMKTFEAGNGGIIIQDYNGYQYILGASGQHTKQDFLPENFSKVAGAGKILSNGKKVMDLEYISSSVELPKLTIDKGNVYIKALD